jgi:hypothetical protein
MEHYQTSGERFKEILEKLEGNLYWRSPVKAFERLK